MATLTLEDKNRNYAGIRKMMEDEDIDVLVGTGDGPIKYIGGEFYNTRWANAVFFKDKDIEPIAFIGGPGREYLLNLTEKYSPYYWIKDTRMNGPGVIAKAIIENLKSAENINIGITLRGMAAEVYEGLKSDLSCANFKIIDAPFDRIRRRKQGNELTLLRESPLSVDICCERLKDVVRPGVTPNDIWADWEYVMRKMGARDTLNQMCVDKKDISSVLPTWVCEQIPLEKGDLMTCEITSGAGGYVTQKIQQVSLGQPPQVMLDMVHAVDEAIWAAADMIGPGVNSRNVLEKINEKIEEAGFLSPAQFPAGPVSHMSGLEVDEGTFMPDEDNYYEEGMLFVIHPSAAVKGWTRGDYAVFGPGTMFLVTATGVESLNKFSNDIVVIDC